MSGVRNNLGLKLLKKLQQEFPGPYHPGRGECGGGDFVALQFDIWPVVLSLASAAPSSRSGLASRESLGVTEALLALERQYFVAFLAKLCCYSG
jgi:hypothetical protein